MLKGLLHDGHNGSLSSKRIITFLAFILCSIGFIANLFWGYKVESYMFEGMIYIAMAGLGVTVAEKFAPKSYNNQNPTYFNNINKTLTSRTPIPTYKEREL